MRISLAKGLWPSRKEPLMIAYITVGADDMERAEQFYSAFLPALGYRLEHYHGDLSYIPTPQPGEAVLLFRTGLRLF